MMKSNKRLNEIIRYLKGKPLMLRKKVCREFQITDATLMKYARELKALGFLRRENIYHRYPEDNTKSFFSKYIGVNAKAKPLNYEK